jgi:hypothetical protein
MAGVPLPSLTGGAGGSAGPSTATQGGIGSITPAFDSSNWTVATGKAKATGGTALPTWALIAGAAVGAYLLWKKR